MPLSPPTVLGGVCFLTRIMQKQATHGTQSMGFVDIHQPKSKDVFCLRVNPWLMLPLSLIRPWLSLTHVNFTYSAFQQYKYLSQLAFHARIYFLLSALLF